MCKRTLCCRVDRSFATWAARPLALNLRTSLNQSDPRQHPSEQENKANGCIQAYGRRLTMTRTGALHLEQVLSKPAATAALFASCNGEQSPQPMLLDASCPNDKARRFGSRTLQPVIGGAVDISRSRDFICLHGSCSRGGASCDIFSTGVLHDGQRGHVILIGFCQY